MEKRKACGHSFPSEIEYDEPHTLKALKEGTPSYRGFFLFWATETGGVSQSVFGINSYTSQRLAL